ncbi:MAG: winged helix-turn-helix domain-containing protein [Candidatus Methanomethylicia archaeon]
MELKIQLVRDGEVIWELPITSKTYATIDDVWNRCEEIAEIFEALSHETRIKMLMKLMEEYPEPVSFAEIMREFDLNPKIVWENIRKLSVIGILEKSDRGRYQCSKNGRILFTTLALTLTKIMELLNELEVM